MKTINGYSELTQMMGSKLRKCIKTGPDSKLCI